MFSTQSERLKEAKLIWIVEGNEDSWYNIGEYEIRYLLVGALRK
jgi:hypothetical protein